LEGIPGWRLKWKEAFMAQSFRDLQVWQRAMQLTAAVYRLTEGFPRDEQFGLTSQMRRSAVSIPSNIAEGQGRTSAGEFRQFLGVARGSNCEVQTQLEIARALNFGKASLIDEVESLSNEVRKMLFGLMASVKTRSGKQPSSVN
jgi:four helix bundle protein